MGFSGFSRQEYLSGLSCPPPGDLHTPGTESVFLMSPALAGSFFITSPIHYPELKGGNAMIKFFLSSVLTMFSS